MARYQISHVTRNKGTLKMVEQDTEIGAVVYALEILKYVPAKCVLSLESVCKDWLQLIRSSYFVSRHLSRCNSRIRVLVVHNFFNIMLEYNNYHQLTNRRIDYPPQVYCPPPIATGHRILGSADGLMCTLGRASGKYAPCVFNPSTGKCSVLQLSPLPNLFPSFKCSWFGNLADGEYVLVIALSYGLTYHEIWVYNFTQSSNILNRICSTRISDVPYFNSLKYCGTFVQGVVHWPIENFEPNSPTRYKILAYHLGKNEARVISPPCQYDFRLGLFVDGCSLIATTKENRVSVSEVWIMREDRWTKYANIRNVFSTPNPLGFFTNGDVIMELGKSQLIRYSFNHEEATVLMKYDWIGDGKHVFEGDGVIICADTLVSPCC